jgi:hypothetical protein
MKLYDRQYEASIPAIASLDTNTLPPALPSAVTRPDQPDNFTSTAEDFRRFLKADFERRLAAVKRKPQDSGF